MRQKPILMGGKVRRKNNVEYGKVFPREKYPVIYPKKTAPPSGWKGAGGDGDLDPSFGDIALTMVRYLTDAEINELMLPFGINDYTGDGLLVEQKPELWALILLDILVLIDTDFQKEWERSQRSSEADEPNVATTSH